jgi:hypothetical protein
MKRIPMIAVTAVLAFALCGCESGGKSESTSACCKGMVCASEKSSCSGCKKEVATADMTLKCACGATMPAKSVYAKCSGCDKMCAQEKTTCSKCNKQVMTANMQMTCSSCAK